MNKKQPHVYALPEDDADRQIADGFCLHPGVDTRRIQVMPPVGGWEYVLHKFVDEYISILRRHPDAYVVMIIDFDGRTDERRAQFDQSIPTDLKTRVFVLGSKDNPETLRRELKRGLEAIGILLAQDCDQGTMQVWNHPQLAHNDADRQRLDQTVKSFLFTARSQGGDRD